MCGHVGGPENSGDIGAPSLRRETWLMYYVTPAICYHTKFRCCVSNRLGVIMEIRQKIWPLKFQGHSRSLKPTLTHRLPATSYYYSVDNHGPISYRFRDKRRFFCRIANFSHPLCLIPQLREFPLEFCNGSSAEKLNHASTGRWKESDDMCIHFDSIPECDEQTDGLIFHNNIALCMHRHANRNKNDEAQDLT